MTAENGLRRGPFRLNNLTYGGTAGMEASPIVLAVAETSPILPLKCGPEYALVRYHAQMLLRKYAGSVQEKNRVSISTSSLNGAYR